MEEVSLICRECMTNTQGPEPAARVRWIVCSDCHELKRIKAIRKARWRMFKGVLISFLPGTKQQKLRRLWGPAHGSWYDLENYRNPSKK